MNNFTVSMYLTITAENEEEARKIVDGLEIRTAKPEDEEKIIWNSLNTEVEVQPDF